MSLLITACLNPRTSQVEFFEMLGMPFGATHAVHNFNRVAEWLVRVIRRYFFLVLEHYFDDYFMTEPAFSINVGMECLREAMVLFGFKLDPDKS